VEYGRQFFEAPPSGFASAALLDPRGALEFAAPDAGPRPALAGREEISITGS